MTENEYEREGAGPIPIQSAEAAGLEGIDESDKDEETREAEAEHGPEEDAVEAPGEDEE